MKRSSWVDSCSFSRIFRCFFFLLSFSFFFVPTTNAQVMHRRLWPWPIWPGPYQHPWPRPPAHKPNPPPGPPPPVPSPCPPTPPKPQPKPPPAPGPSACPPTPPKPQPKPGPSPSPPKPPAPAPKPIPPPSPTPKPIPAPPPKPSPPKPSAPPPKPAPPKPSAPPPKPAPPKPSAPPPKPAPPKPPAPSPPKPQNKTIPAVFFFGDSSFDTGNNNNRSTKMKSNYRPYGMDFKFKVATGRFSNGKVASDYIAKYLGVKKIVPAYSDPKLQLSDLLTGVSFASGGAGYNPKTSKSQKAISLMDQLTNFQNYIERVNKLVRQEDSTTGEVLAGLEKTNQLIAKGVAVVDAGSNDLITTYFGNRAQRRKKDIDAFTTIMADSAASFVLQLYGYGARRIGVVGTPPLGCLPSQRRKKKKRCKQKVNYAAQLFNSKLLIILGQLSKTLRNSTLVYMDVYTIFSQMLENPKEYGFEEVKKPCCRTKLFSGILCKKSTSKICSNTSSYLFWDGVHPTQRAYKTINKALVKEYLPIFSK